MKDIAEKERFISIQLVPIFNIFVNYNFMLLNANVILTYKVDKDNTL